MRHTCFIAKEDPKINTWGSPRYLDNNYYSKQIIVYMQKDGSYMLVLIKNKVKDNSTRCMFSLVVKFSLTHLLYGLVLAVVVVVVVPRGTFSSGSLVYGVAYSTFSITLTLGGVSPFPGLKCWSHNFIHKLL